MWHLRGLRGTLTQTFCLILRGNTTVAGIIFFIANTAFAAFIKFDDYWVAAISLCLALSPGFLFCLYLHLRWIPYILLNTELKPVVSHSTLIKLPGSPSHKMMLNMMCTTCIGLMKHNKQYLPCAWLLSIQSLDQRFIDESQHVVRTFSNFYKMVCLSDVGLSKVRFLAQVFEQKRHAMGMPFDWHLPGVKPDPAKKGFVEVEAANIYDWSLDSTWGFSRLWTQILKGLNTDPMHSGLWGSEPAWS